MVPTLTCGLLRSNFFLATCSFSLSIESPPRGSNPRPRPYQGRALPTELGGRARPFRHKNEVALRDPIAPGRKDYPPRARRPSTRFAAELVGRRGHVPRCARRRLLAAGAHAGKRLGDEEREPDRADGAQRRAELQTEHE